MAAPEPPLAELFDRHRLILFDGVCPLCSGFVAFVVKRDRAAVFRFVSVQSGLGQSILSHFGQPRFEWESNVLVEDGRAYFKSAAFCRIVRRLPRPWRWLAAACLVPRGTRDWLYDRIALNRYRLFGRYDRCIVPPADAAARFLA
jgi:predicted DCC family thiol-disulfide oxidoreductase YuxK